MKMLEIKKLYKDYGNHIAVDGIDLKIEKGQIYGILGPNGAGKSTTIGMICGLIKKTSGEIIYEEETNKIRKWKENIGIVPQDFAVYWDLTAEDNISFFCSLYGFKGEELIKRTNRTLDFVGLTEVKNKKASEFSGGMKRRLNIGCAIAHSPKLIIMDEPTVGIDPQSRNHILESVKRLREEGATIIYTSHYMQEVDDICDRIAVIDNGHIIAEGTSEELKELIQNKNNLIVSVAKRIDGLEEKLKEITGVEKVIFLDNEYKISTLKSSNLITSIVAAISENGGDIKNIINEEPSLETVFLALTGKNLRES
ncbi:ABC transporter ATP-binding protein [Clostridium saccharoperbutylacetonicum]|jgi:ABC-2 type transport system ATP-binding protein|uniref:ABC-type multidrug transport system, ATPase component n=1 Tax=Clostridium saccharoperbutylacetonicum N1-4(HMT) TaxID=931276 RepID=M1LND2_9CLOT|nr:ABC transporter ATP-binding protein [Clostridium saccharoperbutylacetonicum]AGF54310.1 ABC-type multidrug transport system, ATPase component [Clostridium saccharoperbutylacetonicum N1-4(HMT)]AQR93227.1 daunorubicin/doxorubicin resistance ATP-binding protein DrrA [Clostridium saccharoperbutylacetonicum]NRT59174.1 ABC-2 type transport system ATP-binding protein [Clostridium saccharoperbutylacetonicum]NSB28363.1 ABC-2 type transport system ATP-binding protein [Clostridium saccharoperbutylaceton